MNMWPILGPIESNQAFQSVQRSLFAGKSPQSPYQITSNRKSPSVLIQSNIRYLDPISSTCLIIYSLILLLLCALPILALTIYFRQALKTFYRTNRLPFPD